MYRLDLEKAEDPEIKLPTSLDHGESKGIPEKSSTSASLPMLKLFIVWITTNWKILKERGISEHLTCLLRNLYAGQEAQLELDMEQWTVRSVKEYVKVIYCHPVYLNHMQGTSHKMLGWMNHRLKSGLLGEISTASDMHMMLL